MPSSSFRHSLINELIPQKTVHFRQELNFITQAWRISSYVYGEKGKNYLTYTARTNRYLTTIAEPSNRGQHHLHYLTDDRVHSKMDIRVVENKLLNCGSAWIRRLVAGPTPRKRGFTPRPHFLRLTLFLPRQYHFINAQYTFIVTDTIWKDKNW